MEPNHEHMECEALLSQTRQENFMDTGLFAAVLQAYKSKGKKPRKILRYVKNLRNPKARTDYSKKRK